MQRDCFRNYLRGLGYKFRRDAPNVQIWSHPQTQHQVHLPRTDQVSDAWVARQLQHLGQTHEDIERFIATCKC